MCKILRLILSFCFVLSSFSLFAQTNFLGPQKIEFNGESYNLVWSAKTHKIRYVEDFLPKKNSISHFSSKISLDYIAADIEREKIVKSKIDELSSQKEEGTVSSFSSQKALNGDDIVEYIVVATDGQTIFVAEWNVCRYLNIGKGVMLIQFKKREYNVTEKKFKAMVEKNRDNWINTISNLPVSSFKLKE